MRVAIVYCYAMIPGTDFESHAARFIASYANCPAQYPHQSVVVCNGGKPDFMAQAMFGAMENLTFLEHDNSGYDLGAFQMASRAIPCDLMVFFGKSAWVTRPGWLDRIVRATERHGFALYGTMGNAGDDRVRVSPHVRTTGFWIAPSILNRYPFVVKQASQRYEFEHGPTCLANWITKQGLHVWVVTWSSEFLRHQWDYIPNGFHRGDQSDLIVRDRLTESPYY